jgi:hypothetical protein
LNDRIGNIPSAIMFLASPNYNRDYSKSKIEKLITDKSKDVEAVYEKMESKEIARLINFFKTILTDIPDKRDEDYVKKVDAEYHKIEDLA